MCIPKLIRNEIKIFIKLVQILKEKHQNNNNNNKIKKNKKNVSIQQINRVINFCIMFFMSDKKCVILFKKKKMKWEVAGIDFKKIWSTEALNRG